MEIGLLICFIILIYVAAAAACRVSSDADRRSEEYYAELRYKQEEGYVS